jgi:hypothetical protein
MSELGPSCVKTRESGGRTEWFLYCRLSVEVASNIAVGLARLRLCFYTKIRRQSFHTAWVKNGPDALEMGCLVLPPKADIGQLRCRLRYHPLLTRERKLVLLVFGR